ncbi:hypothetical protein LCGC14_1068260 [marine sediment metagenome]|uniref:Uncharacterized protein n=1 Tax=marine sediment metagenome TaxID=412755 RepID=A0A0F9MNY8_9ZZZZ
MNVKGFAFVATKDATISRFGEERWNDFFERFKESYPFFNQGILPTSQIPAEQYLALQDAVVKVFYNGDEKMYWRFGEGAARTTLSEDGPFHIYVKRKREVKDFIENVLGRIWNMFYDEGSVKYEVEGNIAHLHIFNVPLYHVFFEYSTMGYVQKALEIMGVLVKETIKVKGSAKETHYKFVLDL